MSFGCSSEVAPLRLVRTTQTQPTNILTGFLEGPPLTLCGHYSSMLSLADHQHGRDHSHHCTIPEAMLKRNYEASSP